MLNTELAVLLIGVGVAIVVAVIAGNTTHKH